MTLYVWTIDLQVNHGVLSGVAIQAFGMIWWTSTVGAQTLTEGFLWWSTMFQKNAYKRTEELGNGLQMDRHCGPTSQIIISRGMKASVVMIGR